MKLLLLPGRFVVCQLAPDATIPAWAGGAPLVSITRTSEELSIVCAAAMVPGDVKQERGWRAFKIEGPLDLDLTGVLASVLNPLAGAGTSIFALSTYNTDYVLVKEAKVAEAAGVLRQAGHIVTLE